MKYCSSAHGNKSSYTLYFIILTRNPGGSTDWSGQTSDPLLFATMRTVELLNLFHYTFKTYFVGKQTTIEKHHTGLTDMANWRIFTKDLNIQYRMWQQTWKYKNLTHPLRLWITDLHQCLTVCLNIAWRWLTLVHGFWMGANISRHDFIGLVTQTWHEARCATGYHWFPSPHNRCLLCIWVTDF